MKPTASTFAIVLSYLCCSTLHAQPGQLVSAEMLSPGSIITYRLGSNPAVLDTTSTGAGLTWDFSSLQVTGTPFTAQVLNPVTAPHAGLFPDANYVIFESAISRYSYYELNVNRYSRVSSFVTSASQYIDAQVELEFPVSLGSGLFDTWENTTQSFPGTYEHQCVATGSLILPGSVHPDVLLLRVEVVNVFPITVFQWIDATNGAILVNYIAPGTFTSETVQFASDIDIRVEDLTTDPGIRVNTFADPFLHVAYASAEPLDWRILDAAGHTRQQGTLPANGAGMSSTSLDLNALAVGAHLLELRGRSTGVHRTARFIRH